MADYTQDIYHTKIKDRLDEIWEWRMEGKTNAEIAKLLDVGLKTLLTNRAIYPDLKLIWDETSAAMVEDAEAVIMQSLKPRRKSKETYDFNTGDIVKLEEDVLPSEQSAKFLLTKRDSKYKEEKVETVGDIAAEIRKITNVMAGLSQDQLKNILNDIKDTDEPK